MEVDKILDKFMNGIPLRDIKDNTLYKYNENYGIIYSLDGIDWRPWYGSIRTIQTMVEENIFVLDGQSIKSNFDNELKDLLKE